MISALLYTKFSTCSRVSSFLSYAQYDIVFHENTVHEHAHNNYLYYTPVNNYIYK